jgi:hypothetical protein
VLRHLEAMAQTPAVPLPAVQPLDPLPVSAEPTLPMISVGAGARRTSTEVADTLGGVTADQVEAIEVDPDHPHQDPRFVARQANGHLKHSRASGA